MKKLPLLLLLFLPFLFQAQITLDDSDIPQIGDLLTTVNCDVPPNFSVGSAGANQTYDLSSMISVDTNTVNFISPGGSPGAAAFPNATLVSESEGDFIYYQETSTELLLLGLYADTSANNSGQYFATVFNPPSKVFEITTTYNTSFTNMSSFIFTQEDDTGFGDSIRVTTNFNDDILFDGYGTVITPNGTFDGLREKNISTTTSTIEVLTAGNWVTITTNTTVDTSYNWYGNNDIGLASAVIENGQVVSASYSLQGNVVITPVADFSTTNQGTGSVEFTDNSSNSPTSWLWDFGDGNSSTQQNPTHDYATAGTYTVCLTASNSAGSNTTCMSVTVVFTVIADFSIMVAGGGVINFIDNSINVPTSWFWDFGDGNTSMQPSPQHTYAAAGTYNVCLTVTNSVGSDMVCMDVEITFVPVAAFTFMITAPGIVDFMDASSNTPTSWLWDFGDGNTSMLQNPQYAYAASGTYTVCLTVTNSAGSNTFCADVTVTIVSIPVAAFSFTGETTGTVDFTDNSTNSPTSWAWDFGDGNTSTMQNPQHTYVVFGAYNVCLTVTNSAGMDMVCQNVIFLPPPVSAFSFIVQNSGVVDFTDNSTNIPVVWSWDFGDGNTSADQNPQHTFATSGMYNVCLAVFNTVGSDTLCQTVNVVISSTEDLEKIVNVELFPNPVHHTLNIRLENDQTESLRFQLTDVLGRTVKELQVNTNGLYQLDMNNLDVGMYYYIFVDKDGRIRNKGSLIKN